MGRVVPWLQAARLVLTKWCLITQNAVLIQWSQDTGRVVIAFKTQEGCWPKNNLHRVVRVSRRRGLG